MMGIKKELKQDFAFLLFRRYMRHCDKENADNCYQHFVEYLLSSGVIREKTVQRFMISELYPQALASCGGKKLEALALLSEETGLPERTIRRMVDSPERYGVK